MPFSTFALVFLAELGDKTQLAAMALSARHPWRPVFLGAAAAFALLNLAAVGVGRGLFLVLPPVWIQLASAALFLGFGVALLRGAADAAQAGAGEAGGRPLLAAFTLILTAEVGDKTQLATTSLAAQYDDPAGVFLGSTLALWTVCLLGVLVGVATMYTGPTGAPSYCDRWDTEYAYSEEMAPWVALDVGLYESGVVACGASVRLVFEDGQTLRARALDAGYLARHYVEEWGRERPIVADVPAHLAPFGGWSAPVRVEIDVATD